MEHKFLFIDNDDVITKCISCVVKSKNIPNVYYASTFKEARALIKEHKFEIIFTDIMMGEMEDGEQFILRNPNENFIVLSGLFLPDVINKIKKYSNVKDFIGKPMYIQQIVKILKEHNND